MQRSILGQVVIVLHRAGSGFIEGMSLRHLLSSFKVRDNLLLKVVQCDSPNQLDTQPTIHPTNVSESVPFSLKELQEQ